MKLDSDSKPVIEEFFHKLGSSNYKMAIDDLLATNKNIDPKDSGTITLKEKFNSINEFSGAYRGESLIGRRSLKDDIAIYSYLAKYDKKFYRFIFGFYNNGVQTSLFKFSFDDNAEVEIEESLKLYL
jgi:hypothetical protein